MARALWILGFLALICGPLCAQGSATIRPISDAHRSAALELFAPTADGSYASLEETYEALRTFEILGLEKAADVSTAICPSVVEKIKSYSWTLKDLFYALGANNILKCQIDAKAIEETVAKLQAVVKNADSLLDFYYTVQSLLHIKNQGYDVILSDGEGIFHSIKALSQSDGRWRYDSSSVESSTYAAGIALETLAGIVSLSDSEVDQSTILVVKKGILKLFDTVKTYDDGTLYFDEKHVDTDEYKDPLSTTASVVRGVTAFAAVASEKLNIPGDKILGLAKFFLNIGIPGSTEDFYSQIDSLSCLEKNRVSIPLILSLPSTVLSLTSRDQLKVDVTTVLGSIPPPLTVTLVEAFADSGNTPALETKELHFDQENNIHYLDILPLKLDIGKYTLVFEVSLHDPDLINTYATGGRTRTTTFLTGTIKIEKEEIAILNSEVGSAETAQKLDLSKDNTVVLSANHLQKLRLSFQLTTPLGHGFKPHQVFLKLKHETKLEHIFTLEGSARKFNTVLDFLGLVEKFYYLSGKYDVELTVGDAAMENSFLRTLGYIKLDLPEAPEKAASPPPQPIDPYLRFGPKQEISHIFRAPEKRPLKELSYAFLVLTLLPLAGFLIVVGRLGVNLKGFPSSAVPATFAILFHAGIAVILVLYALFWLKLNFFTTLKVLGFLGAFLVSVGHRTLSYLASSSAKLKSS